MRVITVDSPPALAHAAADWTVAGLAANPRAVLALPTGRTPLGLYAELVERSRAGECSLAAARLFNLDEYLGLGARDPHSYAAFLERHLIAPLNLPAEQVRLLRGDAADAGAECRAYDAALEACGGIDLCILGLGVNGHIAFNEPGGDWDLRTHCVELSTTTRDTHAHQQGGEWVVPTRGITLGIRTLLEARRVLLLIAGENKRAARDALQRGLADPAWPVTSLSAHPDVTAIEIS